MSKVMKCNQSKNRGNLLVLYGCDFPWIGKSKSNIAKLRLCSQLKVQCAEQPRKNLTGSPNVCACMVLEITWLYITTNNIILCCLRSSWRKTRPSDVLRNYRKPDQSSTIISSRTCFNYPFSGLISKISVFCIIYIAVICLNEKACTCMYLMLLSRFLFSLYQFVCQHGVCLCFSIHSVECNLSFQGRSEYNIFNTTNSQRKRIHPHFVKPKETRSSSFACFCKLFHFCEAQYLKASFPISVWICWFSRIR